MNRREAIALLSAAPWAANHLAMAAHTGAPAMNVTCIIRYQIDPYQREAFQQYAAAWGPIIPRCGGHLIGYFLPYEGTNDIGWALISFDSLAHYEAYKTRLKADPAAKENFAFAQKTKCILREERNFVQGVEGTLARLSTLVS